MSQDTEWGPAFLATARGSIVSQLRRGAATVAELATAVGLTPNGVRIHLATLERDGWVRAAKRRRDGTVGKPAVEYELAPTAETRLSAAYRPLAVGLVAALHERLDRRDLDALLRGVGKDLANGVRGGNPPLDVAGAVAVLEGLGGSVEIETAGQRPAAIQGHGCPVGDAVAAEPRTCQLLAALLAGLLDREVRIACNHDPRPVCRFELPAARGK